MAMTGINEQSAAMRISDADRNGTLRRLHNAVALGLIDIDEFEERSVLVSQARLRTDLDTLVGDLPGPGAIGWRCTAGWDRSNSISPARASRVRWSSSSST
jgi:hypothetical protein